MKKGFGLLICLFACITSLPSQNYDDIIHELQQKLDAHPAENEARVDLLNKLSYAYRRNVPEKIDSFARQALQLAKILGYTEGMGRAYNNLGISTFKLGGKADTILTLYKKCYELAKKSHDYYSQAACANNIGLCYRTMLRYDESIKNFQEAYTIHETYLPLDHLRLLIIGNIGQAYINMEDYGNARVYLKLAITLAEEHDNEAIISMYMQEYAFVQYKQGKVKEGIETIIKYLPTAKAIGDYQTFVQASRTLSDILIEEKQFDKAYTYIQQGLQISQQYGFTVEECYLMLNRSKVFLKKKEFIKAQQAGEYAYNCAKNMLALHQQRKAAKSLLNIYLLTQNITKAQELFPVYNELTKQHFNTEQQKAYATLEVQYQSSKKEAENNLLKAQKIENEATIRIQRILSFSILILGLLAVGGILYAYYIKRAQNNLLEQKVKERTKALSESYKELEHSNEELERSNEELERFAYIASHDLKQPLNTVISFSGLLNKELEGKLDTRTKSYFNYVVKGSHQMKCLIEDILEYSKLGQENREPQIIDLNLLVKEVSVAITEVLVSKNAHVNVVGILPAIKEEKIKMLLLLKNLIENGIKYNQSSTPTIHIHQSKHDLFTRLSFTDNGIGIEEKYFPKLFKMFSRLQNSKDYEGTGLGLSLCKKVVNNIGGAISVESEPGKGSTFHVDIPNELLVKKEAVEELSEV